MRALHECWLGCQEGQTDGAGPTRHQRDRRGLRNGLVGAEAEAVWVVVPSIHLDLSFPLDSEKPGSSVWRSHMDEVWCRLHLQFSVL